MKGRKKKKCEEKEEGEREREEEKFFKKLVRGSERYCVQSE